MQLFKRFISGFIKEIPIKGGLNHQKLEGGVDKVQVSGQLTFNILIIIASYLFFSGKLNIDNFKIFVEVIKSALW